MSNNCLCNLFDGNNSCTWIIIIALLILFCGNGCGSNYGNNGCGYSNGCGC